MKKYIRFYDDVLTSEQCQNIINKFHASDKLKPINEGLIKFTELNFSQAYPEENDNFVELFKYMLDVYKKDCQMTDVQFPSTFSFEEIRMKMYEPETDYFKEHVDCYNLESCKRFLVMFLYLDDNEEGMTEFPDFKIAIKPKAGRMVIFPPMWNYLHEAKKAISKPKYIIGSYLHYAI